MSGLEIPKELIGYYEDWVDGRMVEVEAVLVEDVPRVVAAELERLAAHLLDAVAEQIKSSPCFNDYDESTVNEIAVRVTALRKRATELRGEQ